MLKGLNLISLETRKTIQFIRLKKKVKTVVFLFLTLFVLVSLSVLLAFLWLNRTVKSNEEKIAALEEGIKSLERTESYAVTIADRVGGVKKILQERKDYLEVLSDLKTFSIPGFELEGLELARGANLKITGSCRDNQALASLNYEVEKLMEQKKYRNIIFPSVSLRANGRYSVSLELER